MSLFDPFNLGQGFKRYFELVPGVSEELKDAVYGIRHSVYCEELGFEPVGPDRRERDEYDAHSEHILIRSAPSDRFIGCMRLVRARPEQPLYPFPFERTCNATLDRRVIDPLSVARGTVAEISRLAVVRDFRRRKGEQRTADAVGNLDFGSETRPRFPYIQVGLYLGTFALATRLGIDTLFVLTEPRLAEHFTKLGVRVRQIGGPVEHRGMRAPFVMNVKEAIAGLRFYVRPLYRVIEQEIDAGYRQAPTLH